jgi:lactate dehydrogenase-like 2-hydroxyacid dehydrogenase
MAVMTDRFVTAAELMARVLGMPGYAFTVVPHPISSATEDALQAMAGMTITQVRRLLFHDTMP